MSEQEIIPRDVALKHWVEQARADPERYRDRQVIEILLHAIGITQELKATLLLKGGTLMSLAFGSTRSTDDVDFTARARPEPFTGNLRDQLDTALRRSSAALGYADLVTRVQRIDKRPRPDNFETADFPGLQITIASAERGTPEEKHLLRGQGLRVLDVDISFNEPVVSTQEIRLDDPKVTIQAYSLVEVIAEKLRALLQQITRGRYRRQDIYDIDWLLNSVPAESVDGAAILHAFLEKSRARGLSPTRKCLRDPKVKQHAEQEWKSMALEIGDLPPFDECFERVCIFFEALPW